MATARKVFESDALEMLDEDVLPKVNGYLGEHGISLSLVPEADVDREAMLHCVGKIFFSLQTEGDVYPVAVNIPLIYDYLMKHGSVDDDTELYCQLLGTLWHEAGHALYDHYELHYVSDADEEELAEEFSDYMMREYTGHDASMLLDLISVLGS